MGIFDKLFGKKETPSEPKKDCCSKKEVEETKKEKNTIMGEETEEQRLIIKHHDEISEKLSDQESEGEITLSEYYMLEEKNRVTKIEKLKKTGWVEQVGENKEDELVKDLFKDGNIVINCFGWNIREIRKHEVNTSTNYISRQYTDM